MNQAFYKQVAPPERAGRRYAALVRPGYIPLVISAFGEDCMVKAENL